MRPKTIQNDLIDIIGNCIRDPIVAKISAGKYFALLSDEVAACSNIEQLSVTIRYVAVQCDLKEESLGFLSLQTRCLW